MLFGNGPMWMKLKSFVHQASPLSLNLLLLKTLQDQTHLLLNSVFSISPVSAKWSPHSWVTFILTFLGYYFLPGKCAYRISVTKGRDSSLRLYTLLSAAVLQFTQKTSAFANKVTKNMLSSCWRCLKWLTGFAPNTSYVPEGIIFQHILFPNMSCTVENDMKYAIYNIMPFYLCYEAVVLFREFSK